MIKCKSFWLLSGFLLVAVPLSASPRESSPAAGGLERVQIQVGPLTFDALASGPADGELILLLHGFPQTSYSYRHQLPVLAQAGYRAVAPDLRGYSPGARPSEVDAYAMGPLVQDVFGIADALERETFHLVGHDWGGAIAWVAATMAPQRVKSLTVLSTPHVAALAAALADPDSEQSERSAYFELFGAEDAAEKFLAEDAALLRSVFRSGNLANDDIQVYVDALGTPQAMRAALNYYAALNRGRSAAPPTGATPPPSPPISVPTLYIWSTGDTAFSRSTAEATANYVKGPYRFEILEGISHWVPEQASEQVNRLILEHLESLPE